MQLELHAAAAEHTNALLALFERTGTPCHCQYWHFSGDKNAWLDRLFHAPELNRAAFVESLSAGDGELRGVVALHGEQAVGWLKLCPAERVSKLYQQRLYRGLPALSGPREGVLTIGCLLVDEEFRRRGVAAALVAHAVVLAEARGARCIEAFPRRSNDAGPAELWTGPFSIFERAGFEIVSDFAPYPVLRYTVTGSTH
ncbi:MAG TPA: GNAT family N-acetyltransferase [Polyangiaceae bacterium]|nr:GNAT family N-acetyltransferase [Polyangiaceae bacterium]